MTLRLCMSKGEFSGLTDSCIIFCTQNVHIIMAVRYTHPPHLSVFWTVSKSRYEMHYDNHSL